MKSNSFSENVAHKDGGAVYASQDASIVLDNNTVVNNAADFLGGGICILRGIVPIIASNTFVGNSAYYGGALYVWNPGSAQVLPDELSNDGKVEGKVVLTPSVIKEYQNHQMSIVSNTLNLNSAAYGKKDAFNHVLSMAHLIETLLFKAAHFVF